MVHATLEAFDYRKTLVKRYEHWSLLIRKKQVTLGSLVLVINEDIRQFIDLPEEAFVEMSKITKEIEYNLKSIFGYDKINYLALMMVDPQVHFHIIPRYKDIKYFEGIEFVDNGWPGIPQFDSFKELTEDQTQMLVTFLQQKWQAKND